MYHCRLFNCFSLLLGTCCLLVPLLGQASMFNVSMNTSSIGGGSFSVVFDLIDGDGMSNNQITLGNFMGFGNPLTSPNYVGGAAGDLSSTVLLSDNLFLNEFVQGFTAGNMLNFTINLTNNFIGGTPDSFIFLLLDSGGSPIPTQDPFGTNAFLSIDIVQDLPVIQTYSTVPNSGFNLGPPTVTSVSEPISLWLLITGLIGLRIMRR